jgi:hypothetical protein
MYSGHILVDIALSAAMLLTATARAQTASVGIPDGTAFGCISIYSATSYS